RQAKGDHGNNIDGSDTTLFRRRLTLGHTKSSQPANGQMHTPIYPWRPARHPTHLSGPVKNLDLHFMAPDRRVISP
ncbi:MAG: hypothetical protein ACRDXF_07270, partial [Acidimicrobiia bacterium]